MRGNVDDTPVERVAGLAATGRDRRFGMAVAVAALLVVAWAGLVLAIPQVRFVVYDPKTKTGLEVFLAAVSLFLALVFSLFPDDDGRDRLRWVALGFVVLGLGSVVFGYFMPFATDADAFNTAMYGSLLTRSCAALAMAVGLALPRPPRLPARRGALLIAIFLLLAGAVWLERDLLPRLVTIASLDEVVNGGRTIREGLTAWHWMLSLVPLAATIAAAAGSVVTYPGWAPAGWLSLALVLMAGAQLHTMLWPSAYSSILTTASLLRIAFTAVVAIGGFFELRRVAAERAALLAVAQVTAARQAELVRLRSDFSAMVVHELASPLAAVRRSAELLAMDSLSPAQERAVGTIEREVGLLDALAWASATSATTLPSPCCRCRSACCSRTPARTPRRCRGRIPSSATPRRRRSCAPIPSASPRCCTTCSTTPPSTRRTGGRSLCAPSARRTGCGSASRTRAPASTATMSPTSSRSTRGAAPRTTAPCPARGWDSISRGASSRHMAVT